MGSLWFSLAVAPFALGLGLIVIWRSPSHPAHVSYGIGMVLLAAEAVLATVGLPEVSGVDRHEWHQIRMVATALLGAPWVIFSRCYARGDALQIIPRWRLGLTALAVIPVAIIIAFPSALTLRETVPFLSPVPPMLGWAGYFLEIFLLLVSVIVLTNLERTFRESVGVMRWRIKYMVLGVGVLFGFRLYATSQALLYRSPEELIGRAGGAALLVACILMGVALSRGRVFDVDVYPSQSLVYGSITVLIAGAYLLIVGILSRIVTLIGGPAAFPLKAFFILIALAVLAMLLLSERMRQRTRQFVSRHLRRPVYDYRRVWNTFTARTTSLVDEEAFCRATAAWVSETFQALSASVWLLEEASERLRLGGSTVLADAAAETLEQSPEDLRPAIDALARLDQPTVLDPSKHPWAGTLERFHRGVFPRGGNPVCLPLRGGGKLLGFLALGDRVGGLTFSTEDFDLLKCIGDQVAANLLGLQLSGQLLRAKEMEAFQTMSAFFVHDLKNTASTLSLTLQNLHQHFSDPAFREDALRAVGKSVQHLNSVIARLTRLRQELRVQSTPQDLSAVVNAALEGLGPAADFPVVKELPPVPATLLDAGQMEKVVINLVLNAREALNGGGEIRVRTSCEPPWVTLSISDKGCGMSAEFVRNSLFRPFQTTKKQGLGIGMFHSKMIVEAHRGRMEIDTAPGQGTTVRVLLPLAASV